MAHVEVRIGNDKQVLKMDRVPVKGDYIMGRMGLLLVTEAALTPGAMIDGIANAEAQGRDVAERLRSDAVEAVG